MKTAPGLLGSHDAVAATETSAKGDLPTGDKILHCCTKCDRDQKRHERNHITENNVFPNLKCLQAPSSSSASITIVFFA